MCGIAGVLSSQLSDKEKAVFEDLLTVSTLRGKWGSGVVCTTKGKKSKSEIVRTQHSAAYLIVTKEYNRIVHSGGNKSCLIGHARWPTKGGNEIKNVHPHRYEHIIGVHNGTLSEVGDEAIAKDESDSALLFETLAKEGPQKLINGMTGAYAITWIDEKTKTLNFMRNYERPLWFAYVGLIRREAKTLFWASERCFLDLVLPRHYGSAGYICEELQTNKLMTFPLYFQGNVQTLEERQMYKDYGNKRYGGTHYKNYEWPTDDTLTTRSFLEPDHETFRRSMSAAPKGVNRAQDTGTTIMVETRKGHWATSDKVQGYLMEGCAWCNYISTLADLAAKKTHWFENTHYLCDDCTKNPEVSKYVPEMMLGVVQ